MTTKTDNDFDPTSTTFLGIVAHVQGDESAPQFCRIQPTHRQLDDSWSPIKNVRAAFPDVGLVFWWQPNTYVRKGSARQFYLYKQQNFEKGQRRDQYQVQEGVPTVPIEIARLRNDYDLAAIRRQIAAGKLGTSLPQVGRVLIALPGSSSRWIGPFDSEEGSERGNCENILTCDISSGFIRAFEIDPNQFQAIRLHEREHLVLRPGKELPAPTGYFNVQSDADLVRSLANQLRRHADSTDAQQFRKRVIDDYIDLLSADGQASRDRPRDDARLEAARGLGIDLEATEAQILEILQIMGANPSVLKEREQLRERFEVELTEEMAKRRAEVNLALDLERESATRELADARLAATEIRTQTDKIVADAKIYLNTMIEGAAFTILENAVVRSVLGLAGQPPKTPKAFVACEGFVALKSTDEISERVVSISDHCGEDSFIACVLAGLMAGSQVVLLVGLCAVPLAETAAYSLGGSGACAVSIAPTMFSLNDLMTAPAIPVGDLPCQADTLGQFLIAAAQREDLSVVILHGMNRAPPENVLLELADGALGESKKRWLRWRDLNAQTRGVVLDGRILFLATLTDGSATFRISENLGTRLPLIWADRRILPRTKIGSSVALTGVAVPFGVWKSAKAPQDAAQSLAKLLDLPSYAPLARTLPTYVSRVSGTIGSGDVGTAEAIWALTHGRIDDEVLKSLVSLFTKDQASQFRAAIDEGQSARVRSYFDQAGTR